MIEVFKRFRLFANTQKEKGLNLLKPFLVAAPPARLERATL